MLCSATVERSSKSLSLSFTAMKLPTTMSHSRLYNLTKGTVQFVVLFAAILSIVQAVPSPKHKCKLAKPSPSPTPSPVMVPLPTKSKCKLVKAASRPSPSASASPSAEPSKTPKSTLEPMPPPKHKKKCRLRKVTKSSMPAPSTEVTMPEPASPTPSTMSTTMGKETPEVMSDVPAAVSGDSKCGEGSIFCEDFESLSSGDMESENWTLEGAASVDTKMSKHGKKSLYLNPAGAQKAALVLKEFSAPENSFFGRMHFYMKEFPRGPPYAHWVMVEAASSGGGERVRPVGGQWVEDVSEPSALWGVGADGGATGDWTDWQESERAVDAKWTCFEWEIRADNNTVNVWIDGERRNKLSASTNHPKKGFFFPKFDSMWIGWWVFQGDTKPAKFDLYIDDIALATSRIGC